MSLSQGSQQCGICSGTAARPTGMPAANPSGVPVWWSQHCAKDNARPGEVPIAGPRCIRSTNRQQLELRSRRLDVAELALQLRQKGCEMPSLS